MSEESQLRTLFRKDLRAVSPEDRAELAAALADVNAEQSAVADKEQQAFGRQISRMTNAQYQNWMRENGYSGTGS